MIALNMIEGIRSSQFSSIKRAYEEDGPRVLQHPGRLSEKAGLSKKLAERVAALEIEQSILSEKEEARSLGLKILTIEDAAYPSPLRNIYSPPSVLYMRGEYLPEDEQALAIVGARQADYRGKSLARTLSSSLAKRGFTIVSGLARGIDTQAHEGALESGGRTIGVLGSGFNRFYPPENRPLGDRIAQQGCVFSEFPCSWRPEPRNFPRRNRIISGLSHGVVVVQATRKSGSLITARLALEQGKEVFALPGPPESPLSHGCNTLIKQGATLVENVGDILGELSFPQQPAEETVSPTNPKLSGVAARLYKHLRTEPLQIDQLCEMSEVDPKDALPALLTMEMMGLIVHLPGQSFALKIKELGEQS